MLTRAIGLHTGNRKCQIYLQTAGINDEADVRDRQARLRNVGGNDNLAHSIGRLTEGLVLLGRGD